MKKLLFLSLLVVSSLNLIAENRDGCRSYGQGCQCSNTGWSGTCQRDWGSEDLYCHCKPSRPSFW